MNGPQVVSHGPVDEGGDVDKDFFEIVHQFSLKAKGRRKQLAAFLLSSPNEAALMHIETIAAKVGVSAGTVSRAVRHMGFDSFAQMQSLIRKSMLRTLSPTARLRKSSGPFLCRDSFAQDAENLAALPTLNAESVLAEAGRLLAFAPAVHVFGLRSSFPLAYFISLCLEQVRENVHLTDVASGRIVEHIKHVRPGDLFVIIAFPRYQRISLRMANEARLLGCNIMSISDSASSPLGVLSDVALAAPYESVSFYNSPVAPFSVGSAVLAQAVNLLGEGGKQDLERLGEIQRRWRVMVDKNEAWNMENEGDIDPES